jgi:hypothetical protein
MYCYISDSLWCADDLYLYAMKLIIRRVEVHQM